MTDNSNNSNPQDQETILIFSKKEILLVFIFIILFSMLSFALGIRYGKKVAFEKSGITHADQQLVEMKSQKEEEVAKMMSMQRGVPTQASPMEVSKENPLVQHGNEMLKNEFGAIDERTKGLDGKDPNSLLAQDKKDQVAFHDPSLVEQKILEAEKYAPSPKEKKYTIQLASYAAQEDALKFADGFRIRGYNPIVSEVKIPGKGIWYRVSLGTFDNMEMARSYVEKEESLFQGQDYVITDFN